jgi:molecular chaperone GrpE (heat shock protein)
MRARRIDGKFNPRREERRMMIDDDGTAADVFQTTAAAAPGGDSPPTAVVGDVPLEPPSALPAEQGAPAAGQCVVAAGDSRSDAQRASMPAADGYAGTFRDNELVDATARIEHELRRLAEFFDDKMRYDGARDQIIDRLHKELQHHRDDMLKSLLLPVLHDVIRMYDQLRKFVEARRGFPPERRDWDDLLANVLTFGDEMLDILERYGLVSFEEEGEKFNPRTQRSARIIETEDPTQDKTIAHRLRVGFRWGTRIIQNEEVAVYRVVRAAQSPAAVDK